MMTRRKIILMFGWLPLAGPLVAKAQQSAKMPRIGLLWIHSSSSPLFIDALRDGLRARGYVDGKNIFIDERFLVAGYDGLAPAAQRLEKEKVSLIVAYGSTAVQAARDAAPKIPIVMVGGSDPVALGFVKSLSHPGGNITGITAINQELSGKRLELLKEIVPSMRRFATLLFPGSSSEAAALRSFEMAAQALNLESRAVEVRTKSEIGPAIASIAKTDAHAIAVIGSSLFTANRELVAAEVAKTGKPAMYANSHMVEVGGLISYGPNISDYFRGSAAFVDRILKGAKPAELPMEQPTRLELAINMKTARALGITIPQSILVRADRVIE